jgi:FtsZ-binding cell division protein ZapB
MIDHKDNPAEIYLVPDAEHGYVWCDTPAPSEGMREEDATRYVREDLVPASNDVLAQRIAELERYNVVLAGESHRLQQERDALAAQVEQLQNTSSNLTTELTQWQLQNNELLSKLYLMVNNGFTKEMEDAAKETDLGRFVDDEYPMFSGVVFMGLFYKMQRTIREMPSILSYLAERDAEVAKAAFIAGVHSRSCEYMTPQQTKEEANEYANQLRQQAKGGK